VPEQGVSDPPMVDIRSTHDKAQLVISKRWHFNGMAPSHQIQTNSGFEHQLCTVICTLPTGKDMGNIKKDINSIEKLMWVEIQWYW